MPEQTSDGFDHTQYRAEVEERWGRGAYQRSDRWWRGLDAAGRQSFSDEAAALNAGWQQAWSAGLPLDSAAVRDLAARHVAWVSAGWGGVTPSAEQVADLAEMYVADDRFAANYGGPQGAGYVRDALLAYVS